jgi:hypothetical protein
VLMPDFCNQTYTAEVLKTTGKADLISKEIVDFAVEPQRPEQVDMPGGSPVTLLHAFCPSLKGYHRSIRTIEVKGQGTVMIPRTKTIHRKQHYLYDLIVAQRGGHILVAVPFHGLAADFFVRVNASLGGKRAQYEKLNITKMIIELAEERRKRMALEESAQGTEIWLTRCQLAYSDLQGRCQDLHQLLMSGGHLGGSEVYQYSINPVLNPAKGRVVMPVVLGFSLLADGVRKTSAITDRHGNFKVWIGPGATRIERLFSLLDAVESMKGIVSTTPNLPILQSRAISEAGTECPHRRKRASLLPV